MVNCILEPGSIGDVNDDDNGFGIGGKHFSISQSTGKFDAGRLEVIGPGAAAAAGRRN